jgi:hypothetical protein
MKEQPEKLAALRQCREAHGVLYAGAARSRAAHGAGQWWGGWRTCGAGGREHSRGGA